MNRFRNMLRRPRGATATEYLVMILLTAMVLIAMIKVFGGTVKDKFADANDELSGTLASEQEQRRSGSDGSGSDSAAGGGAGSSGSGSGSSAAAGGAGGSGGSGGAGGAGGAGGSDGSAGGAGGSDSNAANAGGGGGGGVGDEEEDGPGFNPVILLAALGLVGLLIYVMVKGKN